MHEYITWLIPHLREVWFAGAGVSFVCWWIGLGVAHVGPEDFFPAGTVGFIAAVLWPIAAVVVIVGVGVMLPYGIGWLVTYPYHEKKRRLATVTDYMATGKRADA